MSRVGEAYVQVQAPNESICQHFSAMSWVFEQGCSAKILGSQDGPKQSNGVGPSLTEGTDPCAGVDGRGACCMEGSSWPGSPGQSMAPCLQEFMGPLSVQSPHTCAERITMRHCVLKSFGMIERPVGFRELRTHTQRELQWDRTSHFPGKNIRDEQGTHLL